MDSITQRFMAIGIRIQKELSALRADLSRDIAHLTNGVQNLKNTVDTQRQSNNERSERKPPISETTLRTDVPISVKTKSDRSKIESIWAFTKGALEAGGIIAVVVYTLVSYQIWQDQADATNAAASAVTA